MTMTTLMLLLGGIGVALCIWGILGHSPSSRTDRCPHCQRTNPAIARFCGNCGRRLFH